MQGRDERIDEPAAGGPRGGERIDEIDALKAVAIVTVVFIHSLRASWDPGFSYAERILGEMARFAVPAFLTCSGFLYYSAEAVTAAVLGRRLRRILLPYLVVSLAALLFLVRFPQFGPSGSWWANLLLGNTFGPYYYVFLLAEFVLATWLLSRMPRAWTLSLLVLSVVAAVVPFLWFAEGSMPTLLMLRLPLLFFCWFMLGWVAAAYRDGVWQLTRARPGAIFAVWLAIVALWFAVDLADLLPRRLSRLSSVFLIGANIAGLFTVFRNVLTAATLPAWVRGLSERTYAIYLLHLLFVYAVFAAFGEARHSAVAACTVAAWLAGLGGSLLVIELVRRAAPRHSRDLIGA